MKLWKFGSKGLLRMISLDNLAACDPDISGKQRYAGKEESSHTLSEGGISLTKCCPMIGTFYPLYQPPSLSKFQNCNILVGYHAEL